MSGVFIRNFKSVAFDTQLRRAVTTGENGQKMAKEASERLKLDAKKEMQRQYSGLLKQIGSVLRDPSAYGLGNIQGGSQSIKLRDARGQYMTVETPNYAPLTQEYVDRARRYGRESTQFWNKSRGASPREIGLGNRDVSLANAYRMSVSGKERVYVRANKIREHKSGNTSTYRQRLRFSFSSLPEPLDSIIVKSFISGKLHDPVGSGHNYGRNGIGVVAYPEHFRPLLGAISVQFSIRSKQGLEKAVAGLNNSPRR